MAKPVNDTPTRRSCLGGAAARTGSIVARHLAGRGGVSPLRLLVRRHGSRCSSNGTTRPHYPDVIGGTDGGLPGHPPYCACVRGRGRREFLTRPRRPACGRNPPQHLQWRTGAHARNSRSRRSRLTSRRGKRSRTPSSPAWVIDARTSPTITAPSSTEPSPSRAASGSEDSSSGRHRGASRPRTLPSPRTRTRAPATLSMRRRPYLR